MAKTRYAFRDFDHTTAKAYGDSLQISTKAAVVIAKFLRGKDANWAVTYLDDVIALKKAIPFTRFTDGVGHRRGKMASGRFPMKAAQAIQALIKSAIANAANLGLDEELVIVHINANKAASRFHQGRQRRRMMKQTHVEVVVKEKEQKEKKAKPAPKKEAPKPKATPKTTEKKAEEKPAPKPAEKKPEAKPVAKETELPSQKEESQKPVEAEK